MGVELGVEALGVLKFVKAWFARFSNRAKIYTPNGITPLDVGVEDYERGPYIPLFAPEKDLSRVLSRQRCVMIQAVPGNGKSRAVYEYVHNLPNYEHLIVVPTPESSIDNLGRSLKSRLQSQTVILVFDNMEKFVERGFDFDKLIRTVQGFCQDDKIKCVMTVRSESLSAVSEYGERSNVRCIEDAALVSLRYLTKQEAKRLCGEGWSESVQKTFDGTPKSLKKPVQTLSNHFEHGLSVTAHKCFYIIQRFYGLRIDKIPYQAVRFIAVEKGISEEDCEREVSLLAKAPYLKQEGQDLTPDAYYAVHLNRTPPLGFEVGDEDIVRALLSSEDFYPLANRLANVFRQTGKSELAWRMLPVTLPKCSSNNPLDYASAAIQLEQEGKIDQAIEILELGRKEELRGGFIIHTKLSELFSEIHDSEKAIESLSDGYGGDKMTLRNLISKVDSAYGSNKALIVLDQNVDLLNGDHDGLIKTSVHKMYDGNEPGAMKYFLQWLEAYKSEYDADRKPLANWRQKRWSKRLSLAAAILRVYAGTCENIAEIEAGARFLIENFSSDPWLPSLSDSIYTMQYHIAQRHLQESSYEKARDILESLLSGGDHRLSTHVYSSLAYCCSRLGDYDSACRYAEKSVAGKGGGYMQNWKNYAVAHYAQWKLTRCEDCLEKSRSACERLAELIRKAPPERQEKEINKCLDLISRGRLPDFLRQEAPAPRL